MVLRIDQQIQNDEINIIRDNPIFMHRKKKHLTAQHDEMIHLKKILNNISPRLFLRIRIATIFASFED